jgi:alpha-amylase/alpha-mannosidase (GH57 family)
MKPTCPIAECRAAKRELRSLIVFTESFLKLMDEEMKQPSTIQRGRRIAMALNRLEMQKDIAKRFGLPARKRTKKGTP